MDKDMILHEKEAEVIYYIISILRLYSGFSCIQCYAKLKCLTSVISSIMYGHKWAGISS